MQNEPQKHHYIPQFYMRQFTISHDANKVMALELHRNVVVSGPKSISSVGYEIGMHDFEGTVPGQRLSIEGELNKKIETPFSNGPTWQKISLGEFDRLDGSDLIPIYGFARHLQSRNLEIVRFIETQHARYLAGELESELTDEERAMHSWIAANEGAKHQLFRVGAMETLLPADANAVSVIVCQSQSRFRSSTNPAIRLSCPGNDSVFGDMFKTLRTWWLTLDPRWGALIIAGGPPGFSKWSVPTDFVRVINRRYLCQLLSGDARYMLADDDLIGEDLDWAGYQLSHSTPRATRYIKTLKASEGSPGEF